MDNLETLLVIIAPALILTAIGAVFCWHYRLRVQEAMRRSHTEEAPRRSLVLASPPLAAQAQLVIREIGAAPVPRNDRGRLLLLALPAACAVHLLLLLLGISIAHPNGSLMNYLLMASEVLLSLLLIRANRWVWAGAVLVYAVRGFAVFRELRSVRLVLMVLDAGQVALYPAIGGLLLLLRPVRAIVSLLLGFVAFFLVQLSTVAVVVLVARLAAHETITPSSISAMMNAHHELLLVGLLTQIAAAFVFFWILGRGGARSPVLGLCVLGLSGILALLAGHWLHYNVPVYVLAATLAIPPLVLMWFVSWHCLHGLHWLRDRQWLSSEYDRCSFPWAYLALFAWGVSGSGAGSLVAAMAFPAAVILHRALVGLRWSQTRDIPGKRLVLLRVFGRPRQAIRLLESLRSPWRLIGSVDLILGTDIATFDVSPAALEAYLKRQFHAAYLHTRDDVDRTLAGIDRRLGGDGYYPVHQLRCFDSTWQYTVVKLIPGADIVLMDLRGFNESNRGCVFELTELVNLIDLDRILVLADRDTDRNVLRRVLEQAWAGLRDDSPNCGKRDPVLRVVSDPCALSSHLLRIASSSAWTGPASGTCEAGMFPSLCAPN